MSIKYDGYILDENYSLMELNQIMKEFRKIFLNYICLFNYLFISSQMSAKPYFIGSTGILPLW